MHSFSSDEVLFATEHETFSRDAYHFPVAGPQGIAATPAQLLDRLAMRNAARVRQHPFVRRCANGDVSLSALKIFLAQHGRYGSFFTRYLCALIANLDNADDVVRLAQNLAEEIGFDGNGQESHSMIYARMLADFGIDPKRTPTLPGTRALIDTMFDYCKRKNPAYGLAALCLGAESIVPALYRDLMHGFTACGVSEEKLEFFRIHIECDDGHGEIMRDILARMLEQDPGQRHAVFEASARMIEARLAFFSNIEWEAA